MQDSMLPLPLWERGCRMPPAPLDSARVRGETQTSEVGVSPLIRPATLRVAGHLLPQGEKECFRVSPLWTCAVSLIYHSEY
jgi:hypothetical protein